MVWLASVGGVVISEGRSPAYTGQGRTDRVLQLTATHWPAEGRHAATLQGYSVYKVELETATSAKILQSRRFGLCLA